MLFLLKVSIYVPQGRDCVVDPNSPVPTVRPKKGATHQMTCRKRNEQTSGQMYELV